MLLRPPPSRRPAGTLVESAFAYAVITLLVLGAVVVAMGVCYYQEVQGLAREGARYASVHGGQYAQETGNAAATPDSVITNAILPKAVGLDTDQLSSNTTVVWDENTAKMPTYMDPSGSGNVVKNYVTVTITYTWTPAMFFSPVTFECKSRMLQQY